MSNSAVRTEGPEHTQMIRILYNDYHVFVLFISYCMYDKCNFPFDQVINVIEYGFKLLESINPLEKIASYALVGLVGSPNPNGKRGS